MRLGVFGGSFNPPHVGHLSLAGSVADAMELERVLIIPAAVPPHKAGAQLVGEQDRLEMCRLTFGGDGRFEISDIELRRCGKSYTYDTLRLLKRQRPQDELFLIVGSDMLECFTDWYRYEDILSMCTLCAAARREDFEPRLEEQFTPAQLKRVTFINARIVQASSTQIRDIIASGGSAQGLLTQGTQEYIAKRGLYR